VQGTYSEGLYLLDLQTEKYSSLYLSSLPTRKIGNILDKRNLYKGSERIITSTKKCRLCSTVSEDTSSIETQEK